MSEVSRKIKTFIAKRASYRCEYCLSLSAYAPDPFCIEHIIPLSKGGSGMEDNLAFSCSGCNNYKYTHTDATDPLTGQITPLFHPRIDSWKEHFAWSKDAASIAGITPKGRATVVRLKLNRQPLQNQRR